MGEDFSASVCHFFYKFSNHRTRIAEHEHLHCPWNSISSSRIHRHIACITYSLSFWTQRQRLSSFSPTQRMREQQKRPIDGSYESVAAITFSLTISFARSPLPVSFRYSFFTSCTAWSFDGHNYVQIDMIASICFDQQYTNFVDTFIKHSQQSLNNFAGEYNKVFYSVAVATIQLWNEVEKIIDFSVHLLFELCSECVCVWGNWQKQRPYGCSVTTMTHTAHRTHIGIF